MYAFRPEPHRGLKPWNGPGGEAKVMMTPHRAANAIPQCRTKNKIFLRRGSWRVRFGEVSAMANIHHSSARTKFYSGEIRGCGDARSL